MGKASFGVSGARLGAAILATCFLAGCESSGRLGSLMPGGGSSARSTPAAPAPLTPAPNSDVESSSLPPPPGSGASVSSSDLSAPTAPAQPQQNSVGTAPGNLPAQPPVPRVADANANAAPTRNAVTGNWALQESAGNRCRVTLSSSPKLDLYGAATNGCQGKELQRVNAWELSGSEVILYEPGGGVVARLRSAGGQAFNGAVSKTGAPLSMSK